MEANEAVMDCGVELRQRCRHFAASHLTLQRKFRNCTTNLIHRTVVGRHLQRRIKYLMRLDVLSFSLLMNIMLAVEQLWISRK